MRGVKPRFTSLRNRWCRGSSMQIIEMIESDSGSTPWAAEKVSGFFETANTSSYFERTQRWLASSR